MKSTIRYVTVFEKVGDQIGTPILASSDLYAVQECVRVLSERAQQPIDILPDVPFPPGRSEA